MATEHDDVEIEGYLTGKASQKAVEFQGDFWDAPEWLPRSAIEIVPQPGGDEGKAIIYVRRWLARKNGWE